MFYLSENVLILILCKKRKLRKKTLISQQNQYTSHTNIDLF